MPIEKIAADNVAIVIPMLNEAAVMPRLLRLLAVLVPAPAEIIAVDGGSQDETVALVRASGFVRAVEHPMRGRAAAINRGVAEARSPLLCVLHADTTLPDDALTVIRRTLANPQTALAGPRQIMPHQRVQLEIARNFAEIRNEKHQEAVSQLARALASR
jgi:glycosyltransferase involved in cell wall biosynthesis